MSDLVILTDSTADLPQEVRDKYGIYMVPLNVLFGDEVLKDGIDISSGDFFKRMELSEVIPRTSQPSPGDFAKAYEALLRDGKEIISIHISAELSGTVHSAGLGKTLVEGGQRIEVIDSRAVSLGLGLIVIEAAKAVQQGKTKEEVIRLINVMIKNIRIYFLVDTLEYLARGGRIGKAQSLAGTLLNIKPILTFKEGVICPLDKVRGFNKAVQRIIDSIHEEFGNKEIVGAFVYGTDMELFQQFSNKIKAEVNIHEVIRSQLGPVVGAHGGPGIMGAVCFAE